MIDRTQLNIPTGSPNFIGSWQIKSTDICLDLIDYFEKNKKNQRRGMTEGGYKPDTKSCTDIVVHPKDLNRTGNEIFNRYFRALFLCYKDYITQWPFLNEIAQELEIGSFNLQKYTVGQHFRKIHTERSGISTLHRLFAWMTYLNEVDQGGETTFSNYNLAVTPKRGLTLIWPAEWTHAHAGEEVMLGQKYIITGWLHFSK